MPFTPMTKKFLIICLSWAVALGLISCLPAPLTREDMGHLQMSAHRGDSKSQVMIGEIYEFGANVSPNQMIAAQWYQLAAKQDNAEAQFYLGVIYDRGVGLRRNAAESLRWLFKSGEQGQEKAQTYLAAIYLKDKGLGPEFSKRIRSYRQKAEKGNAAAQYALGWIYMEGVGVTVNPPEALKWYLQAARQGNTNAQFALGNIYLKGKGTSVNPGEAVAWYLKSAEIEIKARVKLCELYKGAAGIPENAAEAKKCLATIAQNTDASLRSYIDTQRAILSSQKEKNPAMALRACQRISELDPSYGDVADTCGATKKQINERENPRIQEAASALLQKDWDKFRNHLARLLTPDYDEGQLRRLIASAWQLIEEETRAKEKIAQEQLRQIEVVERTASHRTENVQQISRLIDAFQATLAQGQRDNPEDAALMALSRKGKKVIASLQQKMLPPRPPGKKAIADIPEDVPDDLQEDIEPGEDDYRKAQDLFNSGRFDEAESLFEKTAKTRGTKYIASAYLYLGISHLARINPANINDARKRNLKGLACFQNALRFDGGIALPAGYDKYQPVFDKAKEQLR